MGQPPAEDESVDLREVPSSAELSGTGAAGMVSLIVGIAGAVIGHDPTRDLLWLAWAALGLLAALFSLRSSLERRKYVRLLTAVALTSDEAARGLRPEAVLAQLVRARATKEVQLVVEGRRGTPG